MLAFLNRITMYIFVHFYIYIYYTIYINFSNKKFVQSILAQEKLTVVVLVSQYCIQVHKGTV